MATTTRPTRYRSRAAEQLQREGRCIDCKEPCGTQRCATCRKRVEENTDRYRGQPRTGHRTLIADNKVDLKFAAEALGKAYVGHGQVEQLGPLSPRRRDEALAEPLHQAHLAWKFIGDVLERCGIETKHTKKPAKNENKPKAPAQLCFRGVGWS